MYVPAHFAVEDRGRLVEFMNSYPFATVVSSVDGKTFATHAPVIVEEQEEALQLRLHLAKANPQWKSIEGQDVLVIFQGPHAMISAGWYADPEHSVPTWNYCAVHCTGRATLLDAAGTLGVLQAMVQQFESGWDIERADPEYIESMQRGIVGIAIAVTEVAGSFKLSQNRTAVDRTQVIDHLRASERCQDREVAAVMSDARNLVR